MSSPPHISYYAYAACRPHRESNPGPSPECAAAFTTRPPRPILLRLTPTEHLWYGDNNTFLVRAKKMHDIYFTLSRIAAIIGFTMFRRGVCAAPRNTFFHIFHIFYFHVFWVQVHNNAPRSLASAYISGRPRGDFQHMISIATTKFPWKFLEISPISLLQSVFTPLGKWCE